MNKKSIQWVRPDMTACVCSWCEGSRSATDYLENQGYTVTHGVCQKHQQELIRDAEKELGVRPPNRIVFTEFGISDREQFAK